MMSDGRRKKEEGRGYREDGRRNHEGKMSSAETTSKSMVLQPIAGFLYPSPYEILPNMYCAPCSLTDNFSYIQCNVDD